MGYWKEQQLQQWEQGWNFVPYDRFVCVHCFEDDAIKAFILDNATERDCSYCKRRFKKPIAAPMNSVLEVIGNGIRHEYGHPDDEGVAVEGGEYVFDVMTAYDLFDEVGYPTSTQAVQEEIFEAFNGGAWVQKNFYRLKEDEQLIYSWKDFVRTVKNETRYLFVKKRPVDSLIPSDTIPPDEMLDRIGKVINEVGLVRQIKAGHRWFRARVHDVKHTFGSAAELGTVPESKAVYANRMSPAGIPMFYGASDKATAIDETYTPVSGQTAAATVGVFETARDMWVVDLTDVPYVPSLFDETKRHLRSGISFLHDFVEDLTKPITKDGREHIEYVPTQIVTEYFRHVFTAEEGHEIRGVLYRSSQKGGGTCCVLFFRNEECCDVSPKWQNDELKWLGLIKTTRHKLK